MVEGVLSICRGARVQTRKSIQLPLREQVVAEDDRPTPLGTDR